MADPAPQPDPSPYEKISQWLATEGTNEKDVSTETSDAPEGEPEFEASESEDGGDPNAQVEGDDAEESEQIRTFSELAKSFDVDEETLAKNLHVLGRDGKEVPLHEVLSAYRAPAPEAAEFEQLRAHRAQFEQGKQQYAAEAEQLRATAQALAAHLKQTEPNWDQLRQSDPVAYATKRLEYVEHVGRLERADAQYRAAREKEAAENDRQFQSARRDQALKLQAAVPDWKDTGKMAAELERVQAHMVSRGYTAEELAGVVDHRDWLTARDAMLYRELQAKKPEVLKGVRARPRLQLAPGASSGADRGSAARGAQQDAQQFARLRETGRLEDAAPLIARHIEASERRTAARTLATGRRS